MKKRIAISVICLCAVLVAGIASGRPCMQRQGASALSAKGKPAPSPSPTSMFFSNRDGDKLTGDTWGPYVDGVGNVTCVVFQGDFTGECQFLLNLYKVSKPKRYVHYVYDTPADCNPAEGGTGSVDDAGFITVLHVGDAPVGVPGARNATFYSPTAGYFKFTHDESACTTSAVVLRLSRTNWIVSTDQQYGSQLLNFPGLLVPVGDTAVHSPFNYHMPFEMNIYCPSCVCAPNDANCN